MSAYRLLIVVLLSIGMLIGCCVGARPDGPGPPPRARLMARVLSCDYDGDMVHGTGVVFNEDPVAQLVSTSVGITWQIEYPGSVIPSEGMAEQVRESWLATFVLLPPGYERGPGPLKAVPGEMMPFSFKFGGWDDPPRLDGQLMICLNLYLMQPGSARTKILTLIVPAPRPHVRARTESQQ